MKAHNTPLAILVLAAAATLLVGCEKKTTVTDTPASTTSSTTTTTTVAPSESASNAMAATASAMDKAGDAAGDALITGKVKTALIADPDVKALKIDVDTKDGVVSLTGTADSAAHSDQATTVARGIEGVKSVNNQLAVKP
ncbi:MAG: BON domain-containing protein [Caldimonas sp.]